MYEIEVVKIRECKTAEYIGRPSPLGNPFVVGKQYTRYQSCDNYREWFYQQLDIGNSATIGELVRLNDLGLKTGKLQLGCYCAPLRCHGDTIKEYLENLNR